MSIFPGGPATGNHPQYQEGVFVPTATGSPSSDSESCNTVYKIVHPDSREHITDVLSVCSNIHVTQNSKAMNNDIS